MLLRFLLLLVSFTPLAAMGSADRAAATARSPGEYRLATISVVRESPKGRIVDVWNEGVSFRAGVQKDSWIRIDSRLSAAGWQALERPLWISSYYVQPIQPTAPPTPESPPEPAVRYILVNKSSYKLEIIERRGTEEEVLYRADVAVGLDGCLPEEKGGRCYFTEPGEYKVRWKVHDPKGIEWCIPKFMEAEYAEDIAAGRRCFRGVIGTHALNIGKSYAIHGTSKPETIGTNSTHGCVRVANGPMKAIFETMRVGDKVIITE